MEDPIEYPWSGYGIYLSDRSDELVERELVLTQFSKKKRLAVKGYEHFVKERAGQGHEKDFAN